MAAVWDEVGRASSLLQLLGVDAFGLVSMITQAALTARQNRDMCLQLAEHCRVVAGLLQKLQRVPQLRRHPETRRPLDQINDALRRAYLLVRACGRELELRSYVYQLLTGARTAAKLRAAEEEIDRYIRLIPMIGLVATTRVQGADEVVESDRDNSSPPASSSFWLQEVPGSTDIPELAPTGGGTLPGIEGFHIAGEHKLGFKLTARGVPINGTTLCNYQWVRYSDNGVRQPVEGATMHDYEITPDDIGTLLAVECTPMDDNSCKGELVREFADEENKITCDPDMRTEIDARVSTGSAIFNVFTLRDSYWAPATMILRRSSYEIKLEHVDEIIVKEKYSPNLQIRPLYRRSTQFDILSSGGETRLSFKTSEITEPINCDDDAIRLRNLIVLVTRTFQKKALTLDAEGRSRPSRGARILLSKSKE